MKTSFLTFSILFCALIMTGLTAATSAEDKTKRPNIVFIFTDDHCQQALSAYDDSRMSTPNMDRIAKEGMRFDRCYVTNSLCGPSRAVIQTGKYSHMNGFMTNSNVFADNHNLFNGDQQTFPKLLHKSGYQTAIIGKWHLKSTPQGFDYFDVLVGQGPYYNPPMLYGGIDAKATRRPNVGYTTDIIKDKALKWLKEGRDKDKPFMLMFQHKAPHRNWQPGPKYLNWLEDETIAEPDTLYDDYSGRASPASNQAMQVNRDLTDFDLKLTPPKNLTKEQAAAWNAAYGPRNAAYLAKRDSMTKRQIVQWKYQRFVKDYLRCVKSVDDAVGEVLDYLEEAGLKENTLVMYSSDQGWYLGEHGWFDKRWMYEESLKTPLLARWPGVIKPATVNNDIVSNVDFAETFLDVAGVKVPGDMQGRSLLPLFKGNTPKDWRTTFYYHYYEFPGAHSVARHYGVTDGHYKLIHYYQLNEWELFDLKKDPHELSSVYGSRDYEGVQTRLEKELNRLRKELKVPASDPPPFVKKPKNSGKQKKKN